MSSTLSGIPLARRRRAAATLGLIATLFLAIGAVAATAATTAIVTVFITVAFVAALTLALMAWGIARSIRIDAHADSVNAVIEEVVAASGTSLRDLTCGCGHSHDPDELTVTDDPCAHDGAGHECSRTCDTCVFARLERTADAAVVGASTASSETVSTRPRPRPRPTPR